MAFHGWLRTGWISIQISPNTQILEGVFTRSGFNINKSVKSVGILLLSQCGGTTKAQGKDFISPPPTPRLAGENHKNA